MFFFKKKGKKKPLTPQDQAHRKIHSIFRWGAILVIGYVIYTIYSSGTVPPEMNGAGLTEEQVKAAFDKMTASPEYKSVKDFVKYIDSGVEDKTSAKILKANQGILVYIPQKLFDGGENIQVSNDDVELDIAFEPKEKSTEVPKEDPKKVRKKESE